MFLLEHELSIMPVELYYLDCDITEVGNYFLPKCLHCILEGKNHERDFNGTFLCIEFKRENKS